MSLLFPCFFSFVVDTIPEKDIASETLRMKRRTFPPLSRGTASLRSSLLVPSKRLADKNNLKIPVSMFSYVYRNVYKKFLYATQYYHIFFSLPPCLRQPGTLSFASEKESAELAITFSNTLSRFLSCRSFSSSFVQNTFKPLSQAKRKFHPLPLS